MGEYFNKKLKEMNLHISRYSTIFVKIGIGEYPDDIARKFPEIFEPIKKISSSTIKEVEDDDIIKEVKGDEIDFSILSNDELQDMINEKNIIIEGRKTKNKMIEALKNNFEENIL